MTGVVEANDISDSPRRPVRTRCKLGRSYEWCSGLTAYDVLLGPDHQMRPRSMDDQDPAGDRLWPPVVAWSGPNDQMAPTCQA